MARTLAWPRDLATSEVKYQAVVRLGQWPGPRGSSRASLHSARPREPSLRLPTNAATSGARRSCFSAQDANKPRAVSGSISPRIAAGRPSTRNRGLDRACSSASRPETCRPPWLTHRRRMAKPGQDHDRSLEVVRSHHAVLPKREAIANVAIAIPSWKQHGSGLVDRRVQRAVAVGGCHNFGRHSRRIKPATHRHHWSRNSPLTALRSAGPTRSL